MHTLFSNACIVTMNAAREILYNQSILTSNGIILAIGSENDVRNEYQLICELDVVDCTNKVIIPGLINAHSHVAMTIFRGLGHHLYDHIYSLMFPIEKELTDNDVYLLSLIGLMEAVRSGTTCIYDHYYFIESIARAVQSIGMRGVLGQTVMDIGGPDCSDKNVGDALLFCDKYTDNHFIIPCIAPHATDTVSQELMDRLIKESETHNCALHMHVSQTQREYEESLANKHCSPVRWLEQTGALSSAQFLAAHCLHLSSEDVHILFDNNVSVAITPTSEIAYEQLPPIEQLHKANVNLVLGTDCVATADHMDMMTTMKALYYCVLQASKRSFAITPEAILAMATINAAKSVGLGQYLGSIEKSKWADFVVIDCDTPAFIPNYDIYTNIVLCSSSLDISRVVVGGNTIYNNGALLLVDKSNVMSDARKLIKNKQRQSTALTEAVNKIINGKRKGEVCQ